MDIQIIFTEKFFSAVQQLFNKIGDRAIIDHVGYKCKSHSEYKKICGLFMSQQKNKTSWRYESYISDRKISYVRFKNPIIIDCIHGDICINYLEVQDQKTDGSQISGIDHVEILPIGNLATELLVQELRLFQYDVKLGGKEHHITYDFEIPYLDNKKLMVKIPKEPLVNKIKRDEMM